MSSSRASPHSESALFQADFIRASSLQIRQIYVAATFYALKKLPFPSEFPLAQGPKAPPPQPGCAAAALRPPPCPGKLQNVCKYRLTQ